MEDAIIIKIVEICLELDKKGFEAYKKLSRLPYQIELAAFWEKMANEERKHIAFWEELLQLALSGVLPQVFENPDEVINNLNKIKIKVTSLIDMINNDMDISRSFLLAFRIEFYMLDPAFETLFHFLKKIDSIKNPEDEYEEHIDNLIRALNKYGKVTPELELLSETLNRLWHENKILASRNLTDDLTNVFNRRGFFQLIKPLSHLANRNKHNVAMLMVDIDSFKDVNDKYGHKIGDDILKHVSAILRNNLRTNDIIGRYGGEEFIVFISSTDPGSSFNIANKLREKVELEKIYDIPVTVSIGLVDGTFKDNVDDELKNFIKKADMCLYKAKKSGRNKVVKIDL